MKLRVQLVALAVAVLASVAPAATPEDISAALQPVIAQHKLPGLAAVALRGHEIVGQGVAGVRLRGAPQSVTLDDKFHLGSDTKAMTATLAAMLVEEGKLKWTTSLCEAFGATVQDMHPAYREVTLQQMLAHRAGLPGNPDAELKRQLADRGGSPQAQRQHLVTAILARSPESPPGTKYAYANIGFILAGTMIEQLAGESWEIVARERLFKPLGITSGGFGAPTRLFDDQPRGHHANGNPAPSAADNPAYYGPAGTAHMAIGDWAKFVALHLRGDPANPRAEARLLKPETFAHLHAAAPGEDYTGGWHVTTRGWARGSRPDDRGRVIHHAGTNTMSYSVTWVAPEIDFAVLIACNQGGPEAAKACDEVAGLLIRKFGRRP